MPREAVNENSPIAVRIRPEDKSLILRTVALTGTDITEFIRRTALKRLTRSLTSTNA